MGYTPGWSSGILGEGTPMTRKVRAKEPEEVPAAWRAGRPGLLPRLGVDFETTLGALLRTPPPPKGKGEATDRPKARNRKLGAKE
jgi:hypothetical protein